MDVDRARVRAELRAERDELIVKLERAAGLVWMVEPEGLRVPLARTFLARAEELRRARSVLGAPVVFAEQMADLLIMEELRLSQ